MMLEFWPCVVNFFFPIVYWSGGLCEVQVATLMMMNAPTMCIVIAMVVLSLRPLKVKVKVNMEKEKDKENKKEIEKEKKTWIETQQMNNEDNEDNIKEQQSQNRK